MHRSIQPQELVADCVTLDRTKLDSLDWLPRNLRLSACARTASRFPNGIISSPEAARRSTRRASRRAAGRSAKTMPGSWNIMLSSARSERRSRPSRPADPDCRPPDSQRPAVAAALDERAAAQADLPDADEPPRGARLGAEQRDWVEAQLAAIAAGRTVRPGRDHSDRGARSCSTGRTQRRRATPTLEADVLRCGGPSSGVRAAHRDLPASAARSRACRWKRPSSRRPPA